MTTSGTPMYRGQVGQGLDRDPFHYISEATHTGVVIDGVEMVKMHTMLFPATTWVATRTEAKQQIVDQLVTHVGKVQAAIDTLRDEILHETLSRPEVAA